MKVIRQDGLILSIILVIIKVTPIKTKFKEILSILSLNKRPKIIVGIDAIMTFPINL